VCAVHNNQYKGGVNNKVQLLQMYLVDRKGISKSHMKSYMESSPCVISTLDHRLPKYNISTFNINTIHHEKNFVKLYSTNTSTPRSRYPERQLQQETTNTYIFSL
jgi:hypothetical protein